MRFRSPVFRSCVSEYPARCYILLDCDATSGSSCLAPSMFDKSATFVLLGYNLLCLGIGGEGPWSLVSSVISFEILKPPFHNTLKSPRNLPSLATNRHEPSHNMISTWTPTRLMYIVALLIPSSEIQGPYFIWQLLPVTSASFPARVWALDEWATLAELLLLLSLLFLLLTTIELSVDGSSPDKRNKNIYT